MSVWAALETAVGRVLPTRLRRALGRIRDAHRRRRAARPVDLGSLRRTTPLSSWGSSRGGPIDRVYIERFVAAHSDDIRGRVLEVQEDDYTRRYGRGVTETQILHAVEGNPRATIVADLTDAPQIPDASFDCVILTQVLQFVFDVPAALETVHRVLAPGGVLIATVPGLSRIAHPEAELYGEWWRFTSYSVQRLTGNVFGPDAVEVTAYGNVLASAGFLFGLGTNDLRPEEIDATDASFQVTIGVRAVKRG